MYLNLFFYKSFLSHTLLVFTKLSLLNLIPFLGFTVLSMPPLTTFGGDYVFELSIRPCV